MSKTKGRPVSPETTERDKRVVKSYLAMRDGKPVHSYKDIMALHGLTSSIQISRALARLDVSPRRPKARAVARRERMRKMRSKMTVAKIAKRMGCSVSVVTAATARMA